MEKVKGTIETLAGVIIAGAIIYFVLFNNPFSNGTQQVKEFPAGTQIYSTPQDALTGVNAVDMVEEGDMVTKEEQLEANVCKVSVFTPEEKIEGYARTNTTTSETATSELAPEEQATSVENPEPKIPRAEESPFVFFVILVVGSIITASIAVWLTTFGMKWRTMVLVYEEITALDSQVQDIKVVFSYRTPFNITNIGRSIFVNPKRILGNALEPTIVRESANIKPMKLTNHLNSIAETTLNAPLQKAKERAGIGEIDPETIVLGVNAKEVDERIQQNINALRGVQEGDRDYITTIMQTGASPTDAVGALNKRIEQGGRTTQAATYSQALQPLSGAIARIFGPEETSDD